MPVSSGQERWQYLHTGASCLGMTALARAGNRRPLGGESHFYRDAGKPLRLRGLSAAKPAAPLAATGFQGDGL